MSKTHAYNEKLKYARELRGWSQEELARRVGGLADSLGHQGVVLDVSTISRWERGRNSPSPFYRQLLCSLFEMNAEELGLLPPGSQPPLAKGDAVFQEEMRVPEVAFLEDQSTIPIPIIETYVGGPAGAMGLSDERRDFEVAERPRSGSSPYLIFARRRDFLVALLASATLGSGVAIVARLLQSHPPSQTPTPHPTSAASTVPVVSTVSTMPLELTRYWPKVVPDIHKKLESVRVIQWMLNAHGVHLGIDGTFWVQTENAVMYFQENANISVSATVSSPTWERLILASSMTGLLTTDEGDQVKALQEILNVFGAKPRLDVDGSFGPLTQTATKHFQQTHALPVSGRADLNTWCVLVGGSLR